MCCSTGVCGPSVDPQLARFSADLDWLKSQGASVERFNLAQQPAAFAEDQAVRSALETIGEAGLPVAKVNGGIKSSGVYPSRAELAEWAGVRRVALQDMAAGLRSLPRLDVPLLAFGGRGRCAPPNGNRWGRATRVEAAAESAEHKETLDQLVEQIASRGRGVVMTMGKGGVGKTTLAVRIATQLARAGRHVTLTTTDPAADVDAAARERPATLQVARIDPAAETRRYTEEVLATAGQRLDAQGLAMQLERDLAPADITPFAWVVNESLTPLDVVDPVLRARRSHEAVHLRELAAHGRRTAQEPWHADMLAADLIGA